MDDLSLINGFLAKCHELHAINADLRERMAVVSNVIEAGEARPTIPRLPGRERQTPRAARIVMFYRNDLRGYLLVELRKVPGPTTVRELAVAR